mgnify:CR=1 FL=1
MRQRNISASVHFIPLHRMRCNAGHYGLTPAQFPVADREFARRVSLPLHPLLSDADAGDVIEAVLDICRTYAR